MRRGLLRHVRQAMRPNGALEGLGLFFATRDTARVATDRLA